MQAKLDQYVSARKAFKRTATSEMSIGFAVPLLLPLSRLQWDNPMEVWTISYSLYRCASNSRTRV